MKNQIQCPNCKSYKVSNPANQLILLGVAFIIIGFMLFFLIIPLLLIPVGIFFIIAGLVKLAGQKWKKQFFCQNCHHKFEI